MYKILYYSTYGVGYKLVGLVACGRRESRVHKRPAAGRAAISPSPLRDTPPSITLR